MDEYILFKIPQKYAVIYEKLLVKLAAIGIDLLKDCSASCTGENKYVLMCWNMFQCACADYERNGYETVECRVLIKYIVNQLNLDVDYTDIDVSSFDASFDESFEIGTNV